MFIVILCASYLLINTNAGMRAAAQTFALGGKHLRAVTVKISNDALVAADSGMVTLVVLLDMSACI